MEKVITEISNYKAVQSICEDALQNHKMIGVIGNVGLGKTTSLLAFEQKKQGSVTYVKAFKSMNAKLFYLSILKTFSSENIKPSMSKPFVLKKLIEIFSRTNEQKLLIIDDAQVLKPNIFKYLNEFRNHTQYNTGILLSGADYLQSNLESQMKSGNIDISEFYNNINYWHVLSVPKKIDILLILRSYGIKDKDFFNESISVKNYRELNTIIKKYFYNKSNNAE